MSLSKYNASINMPNNAPRIPRQMAVIFVMTKVWIRCDDDIVENLFFLVRDLKDDDDDANAPARCFLWLWLLLRFLRVFDGEEEDEMEDGDDGCNAGDDANAAAEDRPSSLGSVSSSSPHTDEKNRVRYTP